MSTGQTPHGVESNSIAVIGMAGRFPGADDVETFWHQLRDGAEAVQTLSSDQLRAEGVTDELLQHPAYVPVAALLEDVELFDADFFDYGAREAELIDPQQRLFLEHSWQALESSGYDPLRFPGLIGVWAGASPSSHLLHLAARRDLVQRLGVRRVLIANSRDYLATRVAYKLNLRGPACTVQTACSTSLVAVHMACQGLLSFEADLALAGGVSVRLPQVAGYLYEEGGIVSPDGHTRPFDARARGTVFSSGVGIVVLKRLAEALEDGDTVLAVIRGTAINNDGSSKAGFTAPNGSAQSEVIVEALSAAGVSADSLGYVEAHGTGTELGDPIEVTALTRAFRTSTDRRGFCSLGSVKANVGHLDAAAGVTGLIKTILVLREGLIPPHPTFERPNSKLGLETSPFRVDAAGGAWESNGMPRRAGVSSFGIGGTNAHAVVEQAPPLPAAEPSEPWQLLMLSARTPIALERVAGNLQRHLQQPGSELDLADAAFTLAVGRRSFPYRRVVVARDREEAVRRVANAAAGLTALCERRNPPITFLLPGQGVQEVGMGEELYRHQPVFRATLDEASEVLRPILELDFLPLLYPPEEERPTARRQLSKTAFTQPVIFAFEIALARLWASWGVRPAALLGHSLGEYTAACLAGVFSFEDGLRLVAKRGRLIAGLAPGAMLAVALPEGELAAEVVAVADVELAAVNGAASCTLAGPTEAVKAMQQRLESRGAECRLLGTSHAFHSAMMEPALEPLRRELEAIDLRPPEIPYLSNLTGRWITDREATDPEAWLQHLRRPVRFAEGVGELLAEPERLLLEVGPGTSLGALARRRLPEEESDRIFSSLGHRRRRRSEREALLTAAGGLWLAGVELDSEALWGKGCRRVPLPTYPFERQRYWLEGLDIGGAAAKFSPGDRLVGDGPSETLAAVHEGRRLEITFAAPESSTEKAVDVIWREALGLRRIGLDDDFFDLGGDSLLATRVLSQVRDQLGVTLTLAQLFENPTIRRVAEAVAGREMEKAGRPAIEVLEERGELPLSLNQKRLWALCQRLPKAPLYNVPRALALEGPLEVKALGCALAAVAARHEVLRVTFHEVAGRPVQRPGPPPPPVLPLIDLGALSHATGLAEQCRLGQGWARQAIDLETGPLARSVLLRNAGSDHTLLFVAHHLVFDGWSSGILAGEVALLYGSMVRGEPNPLPPLPIQYGDYAAWQQRWLTPGRLAGSLEYWRQRLAGISAPLTLPIDRPRTAAMPRQGRVRSVALAIRLTEAIEKLNREAGTTIFMTIQAALKAVLLRYSGQQDLVLGAGIANRRELEVQGLVGFFVNNLVMRTDGSGDPTFREFLERVRETSMAAFEHQDVPFASVVESLRGRQGSENLFHILFVFQNFPQPESALPGLRWQALEHELVDTGTAKFDLTFHVWVNDGRLQTMAEYDSGLFDAVTVERFGAHLEELLTAAVGDPDTCLSRLPLMKVAERHELLVEHAGSVSAYLREESVHGVFARRVAERPEAEALRHGSRLWTYGELAQRAAGVAVELRARGVRPGERVALCLERSPEMVAATLGILQVGAAYVPLDPSYPRDRLAFLLEDSEAILVITDRQRAEALPEDPHRMLLEERQSDLVSPLPPLPTTSALAVAYLMYTSGSTGRPKGVVIPHRGIVRLVVGTDFHQARREDRTTYLSNTSFDVSTFELWSALLNGGALEILDRDTALDPKALTELVQRRGVTVMFLTTALFHQMCREAAGLFQSSSLRAVVFGGEAAEVAPLQAARRAAAPSLRLVNGYGPTENTTFSTWHAVGTQVLEEGTTTVPIGAPLANSTAYVVDRNFHLLPLGAGGELAVGGDGLAHGYHRRPAMTARQFLPDPFGTESGGRLYRTGDRVRRSQNGVIEYLGRLDHQIKLRGYRIELGEIETALMSLPLVDEAVVLLSGEAATRHLAAFLVPGSGSRLAPGELETDGLIEVVREALAENLPPYMIPSTWEVLDAFPLTPNGKIDRKALRGLQPRSPHEVGRGGKARTKVEGLLATIWSDLLGVPRVGREDDFFALGGDSILGIQLSSRAHAAGLDLTVRQLFDNPTIASLAPRLSRAEPPAEEQGLATGSVPLTPIQRWFFEHHRRGPHHANQAVLLRARNALDPLRLRLAMGRILEHHDALRLRFMGDDAGWAQHFAAADGDPPVHTLDLTSLSVEGARDKMRAFADELQSSLRLEEGPLLQAGHILLPAADRAREERLLLVIHHLVVDRVSWNLLVEDLVAAYEGETLPAKSASFQRWATALGESASARDAEEGEYWRQVTAALQEAGPVPSLPADGDSAGRGTVVRELADKGLRGTEERVEVTLDTDQTAAILRQAPIALKVSVEELLLTALGRTLARATGDSRVWVDLEGHGRGALTEAGDFRPPVVGRTVGWFTALYPLGLDLADSDGGVEAALLEVKRQRREVPGGGSGFGILRYLGAGETRAALAQSPVPEVVFNYLGQLNPTLGSDALLALVAEDEESAGQRHHPEEPRHHALEINASLRGGQLRCVWSFSPDLHRRATVTAWAEHFVEGLDSLLKLAGSPSRWPFVASDFAVFGWASQELEAIAEAADEEWVGGRRGIEDIYPLTPTQQGMLFHTLDAPGTGVYCEHFVCRLEGDLDLEAFQSAWQSAVDRHPILRTAFLWRGLEEPVQVVQSKVDLRDCGTIVEKVDLPAGADDGGEKEYRLFVEQDSARGFDVARAPLMRWFLIPLTGGGHRFVWSYHHLLLDGWSLPLVLGEVFADYEASRNRATPPVVSPRSPFQEYMAFRARRDRVSEKAYWRGLLTGFEAANPLDAGRPQRPEAGFGKRRRSLSREQTARLKSYARRQRITINTLFQAAWALLLRHYTGSRDTVFGTVVSGRPPELPGVDRMVGPFINTVPVRVAVPPTDTVASWLDGIQKNQAEQRQFELTALKAIQGWSELPAGQPLFQSLQVYESYPVATDLKLTNASLEISDLEAEERPNYPLAFLTNLKERLRLFLLHDRRRFDATTAERILGHAEALLQQLVERPEAPVESLSMLSPGERAQVTWQWNDTERSFRRKTLVHQLAEAQAARTPEAVAVVAPGEILTYRQLDESANRLAHHFRKLGIGRGHKVALLLDRSAAMVPAVLGVLKAGAAYVPLELSYPPARIAYILRSMAISVVLVRRGGLEILTQADLPPTLLHVVHLGADDEPIDAEPPAGLRLWRRSELQGYPTRPPSVPVEADELAYIIFTSGSTGVPKGVMECHRPVVNLIEWANRRCGVCSEDRVLFVTSLCFDLSVYDIFGLLAAGGSIRVAAQSEVGDPEALSRILVEEPVTFWDSAPAALQQVAPFLPETPCHGALRLVFLSGDWIPLSLPERVRRAFPGAAMRSLGGATEATVWSNFFPVGELDPQWTSIPYGRPIQNARYTILADDLRPVSIGVPGDLYIGGECLSSGYAGQPSLTAERYLPDPMAISPGAVMYRTGDRARFYNDGNIEFLGRLDHQVKIRGFRIELGEIEAALQDHPAVATAVALVREDTPGDRRLVAYLVADGGEVPGTGELRRFLKRRLPDYMLPSSFVVLPQLPVTRNGKLDRAALPAPDARPQLEAGYIAPSSSVEEILAVIWARTLGLDRVGVDDNFFELGGDSILALQIGGRAHKEGVAVGPRQLFDHPTVRQLAAVAQLVGEEEERPVERGAVPLTPIQRWFFEQAFSDPHHWNQALLLAPSSVGAERLSAVPLAEALVAVAEHHDVFRLGFSEQGGEWHQEHGEPPAVWPLAQVDLSGLPDDQRREALTTYAAALQGCLRLDRPPLARAAFFDLGAGQWRLLLIVHHLIVDGVSWRILLADLATAIEQLGAGREARLGSRAVSFRQWAEHLGELASAPEVVAEKKHWLPIAEAAPALLPFVDQSDPHGVSLAAEAHTITAIFSEQASKALLSEAGKPYRMEVEEILLAATARVLGDWLETDEVRLDLESHGRDVGGIEVGDLDGGGLDLSRTIGWFTALFPVLLVMPPASAGPRGLLESVKEGLRAVPKGVGRGVGYGLLRYLGEKGDVRSRLGASPPAPIAFNYLGQVDRLLPFEGPFALATEEFGPVLSPRGHRAHPLTLNCLIRGGCLETHWSFTSNRFPPAAIESLVASFRETLEGILAHCASPEAGGYTPSDFPLADLPASVLSSLLAQRPSVEALYPLSPMQEGMLFHSLRNPASAVYFEQMDFEIRSAVDPGLFEAAWRRVAARHEVLRACLLWRDLSRPLQCVAAEPELSLRRLDWCVDGMEGAQEEEEVRLEAFRRADRACRFAFDQMPLMRLTWIDLPGGRARFFWSISHLLIDGWSGGLILAEVFAAYSALARGAEPELGPVYSYGTFIDWLENHPRGPEERFWRSYLEGFQDPTPLPLEVEEGHGNSFRECSEHLPEVLTESLESLARRFQVTLNTVVQGLWGALLQQITGRREVLFGVTVAGRGAPLPGIEKMVGLFINTLPLRIGQREGREESSEGRELPRQILQRLQQEQANMRRFEATPLVEIQAWAGLGRGQALFETLLVFENYPLDAGLRQGNLPFEIDDTRSFEQTNFPLTLAIVPGRRLEFRLGFDGGLFREPSVLRLLGTLRTLVEGLVSTPETPLSALSLLSVSERERILAAEAGPPMTTPTHGLFHRLFEERAERQPTELAVVAEDGRLTYGELEQRANRLSHQLRALGAGPEVPVAFCLERGTELIVTVLAILKAGSPYLPLEPSDPVDHRVQRLVDSAATLLVTRSELARDPWEMTEVPPPLRLELDTAAAEIAARPVMPPVVDLSPDNLAYILYTSGSTGQPKGVMVRHAALLHQRGAMRRAIPLLAAGLRLRVSLNAPLIFDASVQQLLALADGHVLHVLPEAARLDATALLRWLRREPLDVLDCTPSHLRLFLEAGLLDEASLAPSLILVGGESLPPELHQRLSATEGTEVVNAYGPTECTVDATTLEVGRAPRGSVIGRPLADVAVRVMGRQLRPLPTGVVGELTIAGPGVARGYHGHPRLTAERFVPDPGGRSPGERLYRTGDRGRWIEVDGQLLAECLGRFDHQVKIRGHRIELGSVEAALDDHPAVLQGVVVARREGGELRLAAFATRVESSKVTGQEVRQYLAQRLPAAEVPTTVEILDRLPRNASDKVDRQSLERRSPGAAAELLPKVPTTVSQGQGSAGMERLLAGLWSEVLGVPKVAPEDNVFELGGHSLHLARVHLRLQQELDRELPLVKLFEHPTVRSLATYLSRGEEEVTPAVPMTLATRERSGAIAVIGMSCRFSGSPDVESFWRNLCDGVEGIRGLGAGETAEGRVAVTSSLPESDLFDASFFGYSPREAETLDPQQRLFLEEAWSALESAGHDPASFRARIGCYAGSAASTYAVNLLSDPGSADLAAGGVIDATSTDRLATRVSYKLNLRGPALSVQTACSTSLVAIHMACQGILGGECEMALAGGVALLDLFREGYPHIEGGIFSPDGHCRPFDAEAAGTVPGSGVGVVVLRPLEDALADGDPIRAVVLGSAINNDGSDKVSYTAPSVAGQRAAILEAQQRAGVGPRSIGYLEAHGTGTTMGDPIEFTALTQAFRSGTEDSGFCLLGSVKSNIGHADAAAGVAGFIKTVLAVERGAIPPTLHFTSANPQIDVAASPFNITAELRDWLPDRAPRRAGVSSFGIGGTNSHAVLEAPPEQASEPPSRSLQPLLLSARSEAALEVATNRLVAYLETSPEIPLADVAYTLQVGRRAFEHRRVVVAETASEAAEALVRRDPRLLTGRVSEQPRELFFLFPGQGSQYPGMASGLYQREPVFRRRLDRCCDLFQKELGEDPRSWLLAPPSESTEADLRRTDRAQAAIFSVEYALARLLMDWGLAPRGMLGHSIGELTAACLAGVMDLPDAVAMVAERGRLMAAQPPGAMLAVALDAQELSRRLPAQVELAVINGRRRCVISGPVEAVEAFAVELAATQVEHRPLHTSHAFHSTMMEPAARAFVDRVAEIELRPPKIPFLSNVTGTWIQPEEATDPRYWGRHLRSTVRFWEGQMELSEEPGAVLLEVGPGGTLSSLARQHRNADGRAPDTFSCLRHPRQDGDDQVLLLTAIARLWLCGVAVSWKELHGGEVRLRRVLPTYPFERRRYWVEGRTVGFSPQAASAERKELVKRPRVADWLYLPSWRRLGSLSSATQTVLQAPGRWLLVTETVESELLAAALVEKLRASGGEVRVVAAMDVAGAARDSAFLDGSGSLSIVHLGGLGGEAEAVEEPAEAGGTLYRSLLGLGAALARRTDLAVTLWAVTSGVFEVSGGERLTPDKATALGPLRVMPQELPHVRCRVLDLDDEGDTERWLEQLLRELASSPFGSSTLAYRGRFRWQLEPTPHGAGSETEGDAEEMGTKPSLLRHGGVYLITGGLGRIGLGLAETLAERYGARLALVGRRAREAFSPAQEERLQRIEALGGEVEVLRADVGDLEALAAAVKATEHRFGALHGVLHAAGLTDPDTLVALAETNAQVTASQFRSKVAGVRNLAVVLEGCDLDFCLLASSLSSFLGGLGMTAYAAANAYLNAFAVDRSRGSAWPWISVLWDGWYFASQSGEVDPGLTMTPEEGCESLLRVLAAPASEVLVSTSDLKLRLERWVTREDPAVAPDERGELHPRPSLDTVFAAPRTPLEERLAALWGELLGIEQVGIHDDFYDLGGDSILALRIAGRAGEEGLTVTVPHLYRHPTVAQLATALETEEVDAAAGGAVPESEPVGEEPFALADLDEEELARISDLVEHFDDL